jgi:hypothetical protein
MSALKLCRSHLKSTWASENKGHGSVSARRLKPKRVIAQMDPDGPRPSLRSSKKTVLMRPLDFSCVDGRAIPDFDRLIRGLGKISG